MITSSWQGTRMAFSVWGLKKSLTEPLSLSQSCQFVFEVSASHCYWLYASFNLSHSAWGLLPTPAVLFISFSSLPKLCVGVCVVFVILSRCHIGVEDTNLLRNRCKRCAHLSPKGTPFALWVNIELNYVTITIFMPLLSFFKVKFSSLRDHARRLGAVQFCSWRRWINGVIKCHKCVHILFLFSVSNKAPNENRSNSVL